MSRRPGGGARLAGAALIAALALAGCRPHAADAGLYTRLGGHEGIVRVVDRLFDGVAADARINKYFSEIDLVTLKRHFVELVGSTTGGPETYTGQDMKTVHHGMGVGSADFAALIEDLGRALDASGVRPADRGALIARLQGMRGDIVEAP